MRVYLPATLTELRHVVVGGALTDLPITGFAVTPGLQAWYRDDDLEELEYAATLEAARASLRALDRDPDAPRRRVVIAAEVPDTAVAVRDDRDLGVVEIVEAVPLDRLAAVYVDDEAAQPIVAAAAAAVVEADLGDPEAQDRVDDAEGLVLSWYASDELPILVELL
jgi:hypothetical protein